MRLNEVTSLNESHRPLSTVNDESSQIGSVLDDEYNDTVQLPLVQTPLRTLNDFVQAKSPSRINEEFIMNTLRKGLKENFA